MKSYLLIIIILLSVLAGCDEKHDARLVELDSALWRNPDSVFNAINGFDVASLNERDMAFLNLLRAESADKSDKTDTTTATISALEGYYLKGNRDKDLHPRVNYILGRIHIEKGEGPKALEYFRRSLRRADKNTDPRLKVAIYGQLTSVCSRSKLHHHAAEYAKGMVDNAEKLNDSLMIARSELMLACEYRALNHNDSAQLIYERLAPFFSEMADSVQRTIYATQLAAFYKDNGDYEKADSVIKKTGIAVDGSSRSSVESIINDIDLHLGRTDDLERRSLDLLAHSDDIYARKTAARNLARIYLDRGDGRRALEYTDRFYLLADSISGMEGAAMVAELSEFYSQSELAERNLEMESHLASLAKERWVYGCVVMVILVAWGAFFIWCSLKNKMEYERKENAFLTEKLKLSSKIIDINNNLVITEADLAKAQKEIEESNCILKKNNDDMDVLRQRVKDAEERIPILTAERDQKMRLLNAINAGLDEMEFRKKFSSEIKDGGSEKQMLKLSQFIKELDPEFYKNVAGLGLTSRDFNDALMIRLNLERNTIAGFFRISGPGVTNRRKRLFEKFKEDGHDMKGATDWQEFIMSFSTIARHDDTGE